MKCDFYVYLEEDDSYAQNEETWSPCKAPSVENIEINFGNCKK